MGAGRGFGADSGLPARTSSEPQPPLQSDDVLFHLPQSVVEALDPLLVLPLQLGDPALQMRHGALRSPLPRRGGILVVRLSRLLWLFSTPPVAFVQQRLGHLATQVPVGQGPADGALAQAQPHRRRVPALPLHQVL